MVHPSRAFLILFLVLSFFGTATAADTNPVNDFNRLVDAFFDSYFHFHPTQGTLQGFHQYDAELEDFSRASVDREVAFLKGFLPKLDAVHPSDLPEDAAHDLEFLRSQIQSRLFDLQTIRMWEKDPDLYGSGPAYSLFLVMKRDYAPQEDRLRSVIARERQIPAVFDAARRNLKNPPRVYTEVALQQLPDTIEFFRKDVPAAFASVKDSKLLAEFRVSNQQAVAAFERYQNFLKEDLLPVSQGDFRLGANNFRQKLLYEEMVDIPLDRLLAIGYADLHKNQAQLEQVASQIDPRHSLREVLTALRKDHPPASQLLQSFRDVLGSLRRFIDQKEIITIPSPVLPQVVETPPFARALTTAAMDTPGPYETRGTEGFFEVTLPDSSWKPEQVEDLMREFSRGTIVSTAIHEVFPGHYEQYLWSLRLNSKIRKLLYCNSNSEGWAHYTEQMMLDEGYSTDPRIRMGQLVDALLRDARFIAGVEMHTGKMTVDQAKQFFIEQGYQVPPIAEVEARRGTSDPTYLVYTLGKLQILKLRDDYKKKLGSKFDLREFHDRFMDQGGLPLKLVRQSMLGDNSPTL